MSLYQQLGSEESWERYSEIAYKIECKDFEEFMEKYGPTTNPKAFARFTSLWYAYVALGDLVYNGTFSVEQAYLLVADMPIRMWDKWGEIIIELREYIGSPYGYTVFEYLVSELKKLSDNNQKIEYLEKMKQATTNT